MPAIELNVDSVLQKACEQQDQAQAAAKEGESKAAQRSQRHATYVKDKLEAGERVCEDGLELTAPDSVGRRTRNNVTPREGL